MYARAYQCILKAFQSFSRFGHEQSKCRAKIALGNVCRLQGAYEEARKHLMAAYGLATKDRMPREECLALEFLGDVYRDEGKPAEARRYYARGMVIAQRIAPQGDLVMEIQRREGECLALEGRSVEALPILARARTLAKRLGDRFEEGVILRCLAGAEAAVGDWDSAENYQLEALRILEEIDARHELAISHLRTAGNLVSRAEDVGQARSPLVLLEDAWQHVLAAQHLFLKLDIEPWLEETRRMLKRISGMRAEVGRYGTVAETVFEKTAAESGIIAVSSAMRGILQLCEAYAQYDEPVLITGETGTGKELVAHRIHALGRRPDRPLVAVNIAAIPTGMFERELFGHTRGAFSGADQDRPGFVAEADASTLFLDEIADLPLVLQPKLLRLMQERTYMTIGDPKERRANVRLIAATNANLEKLVSRGRFRRDLYYRLRVLEVHLPPLRCRRDDIVPLMNHFLSRVAGRRATISEYFDEASQEALRRFAWPGNVREVAMVARRAHIGLVTEGRVRIQLGLEPPGLLLTGPGRRELAAAGVGDQDILRSRVLVLLEETRGNKSETARRLGISRPTLYRWLNRFGIDT
jgi:DNA-binding NtrC family response regulator